MNCPRESYGFHGFTVRHISIFGGVISVSCSSMVCVIMAERHNTIWFLEGRSPRLRISGIGFQIGQKYQSSSFPPASAETLSNPSSSSSSSGAAKLSPTVVLVIVVLALLFFVSGLLHLLVRFVVRHRQQPTSTSDVVERQLQQLFHLHDSGLDQAFIDALPVFLYKEIEGAKQPFDCAVCLCEFSEKDKLRLLPICGHAFHISCIDTWLLSNSTCPLCRSTLHDSGFPIENVLFEFDDSMEEEAHRKEMEVEEMEVEKAVLPVRLGKLRKLNDDNPSDAMGETSSSNLDARRCISMGSYEYVFGDSDLRVVLPHHRRDNHLQIENSMESEIEGDAEGKKISNVRKGESLSVSKVWLWSRKGQMRMQYSSSTDLPWMQEHYINQS